MVVAMIDSELPSNCRVVSQKKLEDFCHKIEQKLPCFFAFCLFYATKLDRRNLETVTYVFGTEEK